MLNRKTPPITHKIQEINFVSPKEFWVNNQVKLLWMAEVPNQTSRIDLYFDTGLRKGRNVTSSLCAALLLSGTANKTSTDIHNELNELGAYFDIGLSHEGVLISIYALKSNIYKAFQLIYDSLQNVVFPEKEIHEMLNEKREKFKINNTRVGFIAQRKFQEKIFHNTAYSHLTNLKDYDNVSRDEIISFHEKHYKKGLYKVAVVGRLKETTINSIIDICKNSCIVDKLSFFKDFCNDPGVFHIEKKEALQTAIRIGKTMFNKTHDDFIDFSILNTIFGDYFGSRLMKNIREDKGFTYGIGSASAEMGASGYFIIGSEVGVEHREKALFEIEKEMNILCQENIHENELILVKNYLLGQMLKSADGPYAMMDLYLSVDSYKLDLDFYNRYIDRIHHINPEEIKNLAQKHLKWDTMSIVSVG